MESFSVRVADIQPSQLYICEEKLKAVLKAMNAGEALEPVAIKELDGQLIYSDGHTRALAALLHGETSIQACWEDESLDWDEYRSCVDWCMEAGIRTVSDLRERVIPAADYATKWIGRCQGMHKDLASRRRMEGVQ